MSARWVTFLLWAAVAASAVAWGLKLFVAPPAGIAGAVPAAVAPAPRGDITRVLGVDAVSVAEAEAEAAQDPRFQLVGVLAPRSERAAREGLAVIAVDGQMPKAYRVGAVVEGDMVLQSVRSRGVELAQPDGKRKVAIELPPPPPAATGTLPAAGAAPAAVPPPGARRVPTTLPVPVPAPGQARQVPPPVIVPAPRAVAPPIPVPPPAVVGVPQPLQQAQEPAETQGTLPTR